MATCKQSGPVPSIRWRHSMGVGLKLPSVSPQPHMALAWEGYQFTREHGKGGASNGRVLRAFFQEDLDIGDIEVLTRLAAELGLDPVALNISINH